MKISYGITVRDELEEIKKLVSLLQEHKRKQDEIVILFDARGNIDEMSDYLDSLPHLVQYEEFQGHFGNWKNHLNSLCTGDYIVQLDADELISKELIIALPFLLEANPSIDVFWVSRINMVEGITEEWIKKWNWRVNEKGWINFPDKQNRIYKNTSKIRWAGKVHEKLTGYTTYSFLPEEEQYCLLHPKKLEKQIQQNTFYETL